MIEKIPTLARLCKQLQQVPYLASKNLYRVADYFLTERADRIAYLTKALEDAKQNIVQCPSCCMWQEREKQCVLCGDTRRDKSLICVVETWQELISIEKTEGYKGLYHVLGGAICPLEGVGADDLTINLLVKRVIDSPEVTELILATNQTPEGEATAAYIAQRMRNSTVKISCLARGIPVGSSLEYMDTLTVYKALSERRPF